MFGGLFEPLHLFIILIIALIVLGPGKLPQLGASLGKGLRELKRALSQGKKVQVPPVAADHIKNTVKFVVKKIYYAFFFKSKRTYPESKWIL